MSQVNYVTLKSIANGIHPGWDLDEWMKWPPNVFALLSSILYRTGSYKYCLMDCEWWSREEWPHHIIDDAKLWVDYSNNLILSRNKAFDRSRKSYELLRCLTLLKEDWDAVNPIAIDDLRVLDPLFSSQEDENNLKIKEFVKAILLITIIADATCAGLGFLAQPTPDSRKKYRLFSSVANLLLNTTGSLATIPKFHGIVLPKMRTPQGGIVMRSLTHHLTYHTSEVEVMWRTIPWLANNEQTLNLMVVPYPTKVYKKDFEMVEQTYHHVKYFRGNIAGRKKDQEFIDALIEKITHYSSTNNEIDLVVLPEMSLTEPQYNQLLEQLAASYYRKEYRCLQLPIIVAGVIRENTKTTDTEYIDRAFHNEARMAIFFAGKWYDITQRKHHRWQLNRSQILQYKLEGHFQADRCWTELSSISQRRLSILVPNAWLAMTALICEDLARQEPVSELIRGIGPTLLMALLSDGPQLSSRWSSRYASVLADDPGTAVLSVTSQGMAERSQPLESIYAKEKPDLKTTTIGFWKDMIGGWRELMLEGNCDALLFTISANYTEEFTLDGRTDFVSASVFKMDSIAPKQIKLDYQNQKQKDIDYKLTKKDKTEPKPDDTEPGGADSSSPRDMGRWKDIRELSGLLFSIDAIIDLIELQVVNFTDVKNAAKPKDISDSIDIILDLLEGRLEKPAGQSFLKEISNNINDSWKNPRRVGIETTYATDDNSDIVASVKEVYKLMKRLSSHTFSSGYYYLLELITACEEVLRENEQNLPANKESNPRIVKLTATSFLYCVNTRLTNWSIPKNPSKSRKANHMTTRQVSELTVRIKKILEHYLKIKPE